MENLVLFLLWKKNAENIFLTLIVDYRNILQKKNMLFKTTEIAYLMIYDVIYSFVNLIEKLAFFNKQL